MTTTDPVTTFATFDLNLASYLVARGHPFPKLDGPRGGRRQFAFPTSPRLEAHAAEYYEGGPIKARDFANALRDLKALVYNG